MRFHPRVAAAILAVLCGLALVSCRERGAKPGAGVMTERPSIESVLADHTPRLMAIDGVVGTYQGALDDGTPCIGIMVVKLTPELRRRLPRELEGYPVKLDETGVIRALPDSAP